jgi:hypothetical protein
MALAVVLLAGADLTIRSFAALLATNFGAETRNIVTLTVQPRSRDGAVRRAFYGEIERRAAALPGVESAAVSSMLPVEGSEEGTGLRIDGRGPAILTGIIQTSPAYFGLFRIPTRAGRVFNAGDGEDRPRVVVLSETAARRFFPGENPLGRRITYPIMNQYLGEVIGVVGDVKYGPPEAKASRWAPAASESWEWFCARALCFRRRPWRLGYPQRGFLRARFPANSAASRPPTRSPMCR